MPEYLFWMGGAALAGAVVVGINPTRRGEELARDIRFTQCRMIVTDAVGARLLEGSGNGCRCVSDTSHRPERHPHRRVPDRRVPDSSVQDRTDDRRRTKCRRGVSADGLFLLIFTSGTTGSPKAVRCTQGRLAAIGWRASEIYGFERDDVCYCPMPLFHGNAVMALWAPALHVGACMALGGRFSASRFIDDVRRYRRNPLHVCRKGSRLRAGDTRAPGRLQHCPAGRVRHGGLGARQGRLRETLRLHPRRGIRVERGWNRHHPDSRHPTGRPRSSGRRDRRARPRVAYASATRARIDENGLILNPDEAIGELACRSDSAVFEGYFNNEEADTKRLSDGWYWTGDLAYRDEAGFVYFAGRNDDWLRVDSENFAAAPVERILERHSAIVAAAVYAVPDAESADQVMAAVELRDGASEDDFRAGSAEHSFRSNPTWAPSGRHDS